MHVFPPDRFSTVGGRGERKTEGGGGGKQMVFTTRLPAFCEDRIGLSSGVHLLRRFLPGLILALQDVLICPSQAFRQPLPDSSSQTTIKGLSLGRLYLNNPDY